MLAGRVRLDQSKARCGRLSVARTTMSANRVRGCGMKSNPHTLNPVQSSMAQIVPMK